MAKEVNGVLHQIYFEESHLKELYPFAIPYKNELTVFFENDVIRKLVPETKAKSIAVCSWRLKQKQRMYIGRPRPITQEILDEDYEVLSFTKNTKYHKMLANAAQSHQHFQPVFNKILQALSKNVPGEIKHTNVIYQNHFSARADIYKRYVAEYLSPAMDLISNDPIINEMAMRNANYANLTKENIDLTDKIGISFHPMIPFLLERLFSVFCQNEKVHIKYNDE